MSGTNGNRATVYDWQPQDPSSLSILSSSLNEEVGSVPFNGFLAENEHAGSWKSENQSIGVSSRIAKDEVEINFSNDMKLQPGSFSERSFSSSSYGELSETMSVRKGFNLPKLDITRVPFGNMASSPDVCSPYVTIPPGLSPTMLLDSPVFLSNSMVQASPTTGKLQFAGNSSSKSIMVSVSAAPTKIECDIFEEFSEAFAFYPPLEPHSHLPCVGQKQQELSDLEVSVQPRKPTRARRVEGGKSNFQSHENVHLQACFSVQTVRNDAADTTMSNQKMSECLGSGHSLAVDDLQDVEGDPKELSSALDAPAEDEYNWRKYGQKQVKGSEYPRSYYKCTHPNCQAKKKLERSHEGHITEVIYKGSHNHLQPHPNRRSAVSSSRPFSDPQTDGSDQPSSQTNSEDKTDKGSLHNGNGSKNLWGDHLEAISSAPFAAQCGVAVASNTLQRNQDGTHLSPEPIGVSSTMSNDEEGDDEATQGSVSHDGDGADDETESRKLDASAMEMSAASRAVREPRVVVQTTSEVDILDDGYRWRKYGQKIVKGNPNPRSYYKCTNPGCTVRKHIERASHDLKSVITTYEGRHNHEVPAARSNGGHPNATLSSTTVNSAPLQRPEPPTQESFRGCDGHATLSAYGFPGRDHLGLPLLATTSFPFVMGQPGGLTNLAMHVDGLGPMAASMKLPVVPPINPYLVHHHREAAGFVMLKAEPKEESKSRPQLNMRNADQQRMMTDRQH